ncbi:hypothetical protein [Novosphingobium naphthalenivorans]|uniref:hypothetical protein n=1 Tax=Novosphingobium naphthalenivorans TaxID=273168 RepID=UPI0008300444|nr:hypothetical protein [Novosphingobium naphthalenivorans]
MRTTNPRAHLPMTPAETVVYGELCRAADAGEPCPLNLDLEMLIGCSSGSTAPMAVKRLEQRGLVKVIRFQRFRRVQICASGKWTAKAPSQHTTALHVPRGCGAGSRSSGKVVVRSEASATVVLRQ